MARSDRLFEIIQILRTDTRPVTAERLADQLEVSVRTIYRDIAALQAMRIPIDGEAGIGYLMRSGYDLPPLNFDSEEVEALVVGLALLARTGDAGLQKAARRISQKIEALQESRDDLFVVDWGVETTGSIEMGDLRRAIRGERKLSIVYRSLSDVVTRRVIKPIAVAYYLESVLLAAWCEQRQAFRHFRVDRIEKLELLDERFFGEGDKLRAEWEAYGQ